MSGIPFSKFVPISAKVQKTSFNIEKKHLLLAMVNDLIPTSVPYIELNSSTALIDFTKMFGLHIPEYKALSRYFSFLSKTGNSPDKVIIARWYKTSSAPFIKGLDKVDTVDNLKKLSDASFNLTITGKTKDISCDLSSANSYSDIASLFQSKIRENIDGGEQFTNASVLYSPIINGFIITGGTVGKDETILIKEASSGTNVIKQLGLELNEISQGANQETFAEFCNRIYNANTSGFAITTLEQVETEDIVNSVAWLNSSVENQTIYTKNKLIFNFTDVVEAKTIASTLGELNYTGYVITYDPNKEYINILDAAIGATVDFENGGTINFNFQKVSGYTPITTLDTITDYQSNMTNLSFTKELDDLKISYVYSVGVGNQSVIMYGLGLMAGDFGSEDVQLNESWFESSLQNAVMNGLVSLDKMKLQGQDAKQFISTVVLPSFNKAVSNGVISNGGILSDNDKITLSQQLGQDAITAIENNGYYFKVENLTSEDISNRQARLVYAYLSAGVLNKLRINANIYGV